MSPPPWRQGRGFPGKAGAPLAARAGASLGRAPAPKPAPARNPHRIPWPHQRHARRLAKAGSGSDAVTQAGSETRAQARTRPRARPPASSCRSARFPRGNGPKRSPGGRWRRDGRGIAVRVRSGPFATQAEADAALAKARRSGYADARILRAP
jgi:rare lipoprotein A